MSALNYQVLTIFPELFEPFREVGLISRAIENDIVNLSTTHLRDYAINTHGQIDDTPYGGGSGMVLRPESAVAAIEAAKERDPKAKVVLLTPRGKPHNQATAHSLVEHHQQTGGGLIFLCCRYEGIDERVAENWVDIELSIGDYVMMGGESAAMCVMESVTRLLPDVLGNPESIAEESFSENLLEYPQYTKPDEFRGHCVPEVLLSGHHAEIAAWRKAQAEKDTAARRPDLLRKPIATPGEVSVALIHHPVVNKESKVITSSITNIDLHDIARSSRTFGVKRVYIVHPVKTLRRLAAKICEHWEVGYGSTYNPNRSEALELLSIVPDFDDVLLDIETRTGSLPKIITTSARGGDDRETFDSLKSQLHSSEDPHLILFGTGWGLTEEMMQRSSYILEPVVGPGEYNHLSVRAAAAIILARLLG